MSNLKNYHEKELIERILNGEKSLYELIVRRFNPYLYKVGRSYNYTHEDTQDLMQETFVDTYKNLSEFEGRSSFKTWIVRIMLNNCYQKNKKASFKNEIAQETNENATPMFTNKNNETEKTLHSRELNHIIEEALSRIPLDYRMVFSLREITGLDTTETANLMKISQDNVKTRLSRAKTMLRKEIEKKYVASELYEFNLIYCDTIVENVMKEVEKF